MAGFEEPAPDGLWANIENALAAEGQNGGNVGGRSRRMRIVAIRAVAAAACLACGVGIYLSSPEQAGEGKSIAASSPTRSAEKPYGGEDTQNNKLLASADNNYVASSESSHSASSERTLSAETNLGSSTAAAEEEPLLSAAADNAGEATETPSAAVKSAEKRQSAVVNGEYHASRAKTLQHNDTRNHDTQWQPRNADYRKGTITASLYAMNSMGMTGGTGENMMASVSNDAAFSSITGNGGDGSILFLAAKTYPQKEKATHHVPIRAGLSVRYALTDRVGVETGVTYSYLSSDFTVGSGGNRQEREQSLHFVGIPLNVDYSLWHNKLFDLYASAGTMAELNVKGKLSTTEYYGGNALTTDEQSVRTKKLQWSVGMAAGAQVNFTPEVGLYVEPGVGYYFRNGSELKSAYSERQWNFNLRLGLRYSFK